MLPTQPTRPTTTLLTTIRHTLDRADLSTLARLLPELRRLPTTLTTIPQQFLAQSLLGQALALLGRHQEATAVLWVALEILEDYRTRGDAETVIANLRMLGMLAQARGDREIGQCYTAWALAVAEERLGLDHPQTVTLRARVRAGG
ncbi:MAG: hypothetical protein HC828_02315 [Blastochloris sp.]|nr:hypothetical protein [Blastochloris sp.]